MLRNVLHHLSFGTPGARGGGAGTAATASMLGLMNGAVPPPHGAFDPPPPPGGWQGHQRHFCGIRESDKRHLTCSWLFHPFWPGPSWGSHERQAPADTRGPAALSSASTNLSQDCNLSSIARLHVRALERRPSRGSSCCLISPSQPSTPLPERGLEEAGWLGERERRPGASSFPGERLRKGRAARRRGR